MTRLNLVPPHELTDQHLFAEWREIKMVPRSLARSLKARGQENVLKMIPNQFTLNIGHVSFFYDKGQYLHNRYRILSKALHARSIQIDPFAVLDKECIFNSLSGEFWKDYEPTEEALAIVRARIAERILFRPNWYRYYGKVI